MCKACHDIWLRNLGDKIRCREYVEKSRKTNASNDVWCAAS